MQIAVTGHRPKDLGGYNDNYNACNTVKNSARSLINKLRSMEVTDLQFHIGMGLGVDQWVAEVCIVEDISFIAHIPVSREFQTAKWRDSAVVRYNNILDHVVEVLTVGNEDNYVKAMYDRNLSMIAAGDMLYAVYKGPHPDREGGGTRYTVEAAIRKSKPTLIFNPVDSSYEWKHRTRLKI